MKTARKNSALRPFCAVLSAVFCFCSVSLFFLFFLQLRHGGNFSDPAQRKPVLEALLDSCSDQLSRSFLVYYRSDGADHADCPPDLLPQNTNLRLIARDAQTGDLLLRTTKSFPPETDALLHETVSVPVSYTVGNYYLVEKEATALVEYDLPAVLTVKDCFYAAQILMQTGYRLQSFFWAGGVVSTAFTLLFSVLFMHSAWREGTLKRSRRKLFREIPPDLLLSALLPLILLCLSHLRQIDTTQCLLQTLFTSQTDWFFYPVLASTCLLFVLLWLMSVILFSLRRYGIRGLLSFSRYEKAKFTRKTLPAVIVMQLMKTAVCVLYGQTHPRAVLLCIVLEKAVLLPVLYRCLREIRTIYEETETVVLGDLSQPIGAPNMYRSLKDHADNIRSIAQRISVSADEYIRSGQFKAELITNLSHDIKTPLTSIINYAALLKNETLSQQDRQKYIAVLHRHAQRLSRLVEDLTQVSDTQSGQIEAHCARLDLTALVLQSAMGFEERLQKQEISMRFSVPEAPVNVWADSRLLWRVADNLMNNICKYTLPGTVVHISVQSQDDTAYAFYENIPASPLEKPGDALMERFVRADNSRHTEGNGLGLSIARSLMQLQGGTLQLQTKPSLFTARISLPDREA